MSEDTITQLPDPSGLSADPITDLIRDGARKLLQQAIEAELQTLLAAHAGEHTVDGRARLVRHGHLPERNILTGVGPVPVKVPRVRDRGDGDEKVKFVPSILPRYLRKATSVEELLPWLYLKGVSSGDFQEALAALLGPDARGLSATTISRLKADWWKDYEAWQKRDLSARRFLYVWADGVYFKPRMAEEKQCVLVIVGADEYGRKELLGLTDGFRESTQSWRELLLDLKRRGLTQAPKLAIGDGALGFWAALREVFATTREQRCWVHKTMNVLNAMPKSVQPKAKGHLHDIWQAETAKDADAAFDFFVETYGAKYDKATSKVTLPEGFKPVYELFSQNPEGHQFLGVGRASRAQLQLPRSVRLQDQDPAGRQPLHHGTVDLPSELRRQVEEDGDDSLPLPLGQIEIFDG